MGHRMGKTRDPKMLCKSELRKSVLSEIAR